MSMLPLLLISVLAGWVLVSVYRTQKPDRRNRTIFQYLFLMRYEVLFLAVLSTLPILATQVASNILGNLLILNGFLDVLLVSFSAFAFSLVCGLAIAIVVRRAPERFEGVPALVIPARIVELRHLFFAAPAIPLLVAVILMSPKRGRHFSRASVP